MFASLEGDKKDVGKKPGGTHHNYTWVFERVDGYFNLDQYSVLRLGGSHCIFPSHTTPETWTFEWIEGPVATAYFFSAKQGGKEKSVTARAALRLAQAAGSGVLVVESGKCLGVRAGECSYPFRIAPSVDLSKPPSVEVFSIHPVHNSDLLALAVLLGHEGQAGVTCQLGRLNAPAYKKIAADPTIPEPKRTFETEEEDLRASEACGGKPVNGVKALV